MMHLAQFFEDDAEHLSMSRLLCFLSFWPASYVLLIKPEAEILGLYLGAYVLNYVGGKLSDAFGRPRGRIDRNLKPARET